MGGVWGWKVGAREKEKTQESSLCESPRCSLVHCAVCCQVKLGSTGSVSVKKSILDGRLLPGKSVLIPGLILDQRLCWNDMPLGPKMNTFGSGNWMEMCQVIAPAACFALLESERGRESAWGGKRGSGGRCGGKKPRIRRPLGIHFQAFAASLRSILRAIVVRLLQMHSVQGEMHLCTGCVSPVCSHKSQDEE